MNLKENHLQFILAVMRHNPPGWDGIDERLDSHLLLYVESGIVEGCLDGEKVEFPPASLSWITPGTQRQFCISKGRSSSRNYRVRFNLGSAGGEYVFDPPWRIIYNCHQLHLYFELLCSLNWKKSSFADRERQALLQALFASFLSREEKIRSRFRTFSASESARLEKKIEKAISSGRTEFDPSGDFGWTGDYFSRVFKSSYGMPLRSYLKLCRLRRAAEMLLESALTLKEICAELGEHDISKFCRQFKEEFKCSPTCYRRGERS